jgi:hypothetical protein
VGQRAEALATQLDRINAGVIAFTESLSDAEWDMYVPNEERTVGVLIRHVAFGYTAEIELLKAVISEVRLPRIYESRTLLARLNARHARTFQATTKAEALDELRRQGNDAAAFIRALDDTDLEKSRAFSLWNGEEFTVGDLIERIVLVHPERHIASIRAALGREAATEPA